jgi:hypothetical protein
MVQEVIEPEFTSADPLTIGNSFVTITAQQVFQLRCSLIHSGSDEIDYVKQTGVDRFYFFDDMIAGPISKFSNCVFNGISANIITLTASAFCEIMFNAADRWDINVSHNAKIQAEKEKLIFIHSKGAIIHGIRFE